MHYRPALRVVRGTRVTLNELLNADMKTLGRYLGEAARWWVSQLQQMLPPTLAQGLFAARRTVALSDKPGSYRLIHNGKTVVLDAQTRTHPLPVHLALPREKILLRELVLPPLPLRDTRALVALDVDRLTPFQADTAYVDVMPIGRIEATGQQKVRLAAAPRATIHQAIDDATTHGFAVQTVGVDIAGDGSDICFDFIPMLEAQQHRIAHISPAQFWWSVALAMLLVNLGIAILLDISSLGRLRRQAEAARPGVTAAQTIQRRVAHEAQRRTDLMRMRAIHEPLRPLGIITAALPEGAWVQHYSWNGEVVRLAGFRQEGVDVLSALRRAPNVLVARNTSTDIPARQGSSLPFDISITLKPAGVK